MVNLNKNAEYLIDCWESSLDDSDLITDELQAVRWNKRADTFAKDQDEERRERKTTEFFDLLAQAGFTPSGAKVLDIGCGPGSLSIPLAEAGADVTSLDISTGMLARLRETAKRKGLSISPVECSWWSADIDDLGFRNRFDLVIASMTPGIKDAETFDRMMACSKNLCYYSNFIRRDADKIPAEIYSAIPGTAPESNLMAAGLFYPFMYLYTLGFHPIIKLNRNTVHRELDWEEAAEHAIEYLQFRRELSEESKGTIREYYKNVSPGGRISTDHHKYTGMMVWSVATPRKKDHR